LGATGRRPLATKWIRARASPASSIVRLVGVVVMLQVKGRQAVADRSMLVQAAAAAAGGQHYPAPALYVVATPIGNLADMTLRALHVLALVDAIACEDTRHSATLLRHFDIAKPLLAVHEHNEREAAAGVVARLARGERVACISDAGTPAVSDPGAALVAAVRDAGFPVVPIPGASSFLAALAVAGDVSRGGVCFLGFLPPRGRERTAALEACARAPTAQILFEAPHRIASLVDSLSRACPSRTVTLCRELTKQFETVVTLPAQALPAWLGGDPNRARGEFVLVLHGDSGAATGAGDVALDALLAPLVAALPLKQAVALAAQIGGASRNVLYERALQMKGSAAPSDDAG
jgi:16S rRNA (cytidine1402-2'-O)-methyltransferase